MSACGDFAEHVWKPGSCKNCFHPRSAHRATGGSAPPARLRSSGPAAGEDGEDGVSSPSPYSKPTIAVRPTMMLSTDANAAPADLSVNTEQKLDAVLLKKVLDLSPLYIDGDAFPKALSPAPGKTDRAGLRYSPGPLSPPSPLSPALRKDPPPVSSIFVSQGDGHAPRQQVVTRMGFRSPYGSPHPSPSRAGAPLSISIITTPALASTVSSASSSSSVSSSSSQPPITPPPPPSSGSVTLDPVASQNPPPCGRPSPCSPSDQSDSGSSYLGSTDSLPSPPPPPDHRVGTATSEPIYAESAKRKRPEAGGGGGGRRQGAEPSGGEGQRAKITVMAARTEENNRTFYLSSPDSAVSTQWPHFSPGAVAVGDLAFRWPSAGSVAPPPPPAPQSSPPIPPKRNGRSPKLGASSLSPLPLPELAALTLLSPRARPTPPPPPLLSPPEAPPPPAAHERRPRAPHGWSREGRIEEEEEEEEEEEGGEAAREQGAAVNGWRGARDRRRGAQGGPPSAAPGTANNGGSQGGASAGVATTEEEEEEEEERSRPNSSMLAKTPVPLGSDTEPSPPPPPPKKHHRMSAKLSDSTVDLDRCWQQGGSVESLALSLRDLTPASLRDLPSASLRDLPSASTDARAPSDSSSHDAPRPVRASPFPRIPGAGASSPPAPPFPSNGLGDQPQPPPLPEKKTVSRAVSAPDGRPRPPRAWPRLPFSGSESDVCRADAVAMAAARCSLPSSPVEPRPLYASSESLHGGGGGGRPARSHTLDEHAMMGRGGGVGGGRLGVHPRGSLTSSSSPQLSAPLSAAAANSGSALQLHTLLSNMDSREGVYSKLGGLYAESLRRLALKCEEHFARSQRSSLRFDESNWSLFKLTCNRPSCSAGDAVYYSAACASDPANSYAVKICKSLSAEVRQAHLYGLSVQQTVPPHFNVQQDCGHFIACVPQSMLPADEAPPLPKPNGNTNPAQAGGPAQAAAAERERVVVIAREVPRQTAADFVREGAGLHRSTPEAYERRVCFLLLQLCAGLEHLKEHGVTHRDLCLENLLLVDPPCRRRVPDDAPDDRHRLLPRLLISNFAKAKKRDAADDPVAAGNAASVDPRLRRDRARLAPEIVSAAQYRKFDEFQTGILIYELLHQPNPFEVSPRLRERDYRPDELPAIPPASLYSAGLQRLARLLLQPDPIKRLHILEAKRALQGLLWGPRRDMLEQQWDRGGGVGVAGGDGPARCHEGLLNWLDVKRALLMMKFAERSLEPERSAELEDWLCCQYFSSAHPPALCRTAELLYSTK